MGRMFRHAVKLYVYPMQKEAYDRYLVGSPVPKPGPAGSDAFSSGIMITARNLQVSDRLRNLYAHLLENHNLDCILGSNPEYLNIFSRDVLQRIKSDDQTWERLVPAKVAAIIKERRLLGYTPRTPTVS